MGRTAIPVKDAVQLVMNHSKKCLDKETIPLQAAYGRILAELIIAKHDVPPFSRSAYDGFASRADNSAQATTDNPVAFRVIGEIGAGHVGEQELQTGEAYRIMTGAILPPKADAIIMLEDTTETADGFSIMKVFQSGDNISFQGEDAKEGEVLIEAGSVIHPGTIALLEIGRAHV